MEADRTDAVSMPRQRFLACVVCLVPQLGLAGPPSCGKYGFVRTKATGGDAPCVGVLRGDDIVARHKVQELLQFLVLHLFFYALEGLASVLCQL